VYSFCLNLSKDVEASARERKASAKSYLYGRIVYRLRTVLGRDASLWFALEETEGSERRLHLHGEIACEATELRKMRSALRLAGGEWERRAKAFQVRLETRPDAGAVT